MRAKVPKGWKPSAGLRCQQNIITDSIMPNTIARQCRRPAIGRGPIADWATYDLVQPMCRRCLDVRLAELAARDGLSAAVRFIAEVKPCYRGSRIGPLGQGRKELDAWKAGYA